MMPRSKSKKLRNEWIGILFDLFYRVDRVCTKAGGFRLGLAIAQQIVQIFGGEILVSSEVNQGSQFQMVLPRSS